MNFLKANFRKNKKESKNPLSCGSENCNGICKKVDITDAEMIIKLKVLTERKSDVVKLFGLKIEDFDNKEKEEKIFAIASFMNIAYDYCKCPKCGWGFLNKKSGVKNEIKIINEMRRLKK